MRLKKPPYPSGNYRRETLSFRGLDLTGAASEGALTASENLSSEDYPYLSPRRGRRDITGTHGSITDVFEWDGHLLIVDGGTLYFDEEPLGPVTEGKKQFAVVNTKLVIWPDMLYIDLKSSRLFRMDSAFRLSENVSVTPSSISCDTKKEEFAYTVFGGAVSEWNPATYCYGSDASAVAACFDEESGWDMSALAALSGAGLYGFLSDTNCRADGRLLPGARYDVDGAVQSGMVFIPRKYGLGRNYVYADSFKTLPDTSLYSEDGYYGVFTRVSPAFYSREDSEVCWHFELYKAGSEEVQVSDFFSAGDCVEISGDILGFVNKGFVRIEQLSVSDERETLHFEENTFTPPPERYYVSRGCESGNTYFFSISQNDPHRSQDARYYEISPETDIPAGCFLYVEGYGLRERIVDETGAGRDGALHPAQVTDTPSEDSSSGGQLKEYALSLELCRCIPKLDFICAHENRLWGVSNSVQSRVYNAQTGQYESFRSRCIYVSSLGLPERFWDFEGTAADSYQVSVGSQGDFTAICEYGSSVCCFKQNRLHRVMGSFPAEFYLTEAELAGVEEGSAASVCSVDGVLYYKGSSGIYAYAGGTASKISAALGNLPEKFGFGVSGTDGVCFYLSLAPKPESGEKKALLLSYDVRRGIWLEQEKGRRYSAFSGRLYLLSAPEGAESARLYRQASDEGCDELVHWCAELAPMTEGIFEKRRYTKLIFRVFVPEGAALTAETKSDGEPWSIEYMCRSCGEAVFSLQLPPERTDSFRIKLSGSGEVRVKGMQREFYVGSEV